MKLEKLRARKHRRLYRHSTEKVGYDSSPSAAVILCIAVATFMQCGCGINCQMFDAKVTQEI